MSLPVVLIADKLAESTVAALGDDIEVRWVDGPDREKLLAAVPEADALLVRSATTVDAEVLDAAPKLKIVAPVREWSMTRPDSIKYAAEHNIQVEAKRLNRIAGSIAHGFEQA